MDYHIMVRNSSRKYIRIASFQNITDRDDCLGFLADKYDDCEFKAVNSTD